MNNMNKTDSHKPITLMVNKQGKVFSRMNYFLGVKSVQDAANALKNVSFLKVLNVSTLEVLNTSDDRIKYIAGPASKDNDLSKGILIQISGAFTDTEMDEIEKLSSYSDRGVRILVADFIARHKTEFNNKGVLGEFVNLGQTLASKKWWRFWK